MVVWPNARHLDAVVFDLLREQRVRIVDVTEVTWSEDRQLENYSRFYRSRIVPPYRSSLLHDKGAGRSLAISIVDPMPFYEPRRTTGGMRVVNAHVFDIKARIRALGDGGPSVHSSDNPAEARRDLMFLLGRESPSVERADWDGTIRSESRDIVGAEGWESDDALLTALDAAGHFVLLTDRTDMVGDGKSCGFDLELLTSSYREILAMAGAKPVDGVVPDRGGRFSVMVDGGRTTIAVRTVGDGSLDRRWQEQLLRDRERDDRGVWIPTTADRFHRLLYHATVNHRGGTGTHDVTLSQLAAAAGLDPAEVLSDRAHAVKAHLAERGWTITRPDDPYLLIDHRIAGARYPRIAVETHRLRSMGSILRRRYVTRPLRRVTRSVREVALTRAPQLRELGRRVRSLVTTGSSR